MRRGNDVIVPKWPISEDLTRCLLKNAQDQGVKHAKIIYRGRQGSDYLVTWEEHHLPEKCYG